MYKRTVRYLLISFLLSVFIGYWGCIFGFTHIHEINGVHIVHSHPFSEHQEHTHSTQELALFSNITHSSYYIVPDPHFDFISYESLEYIITPKVLTALLIPSCTETSLRAPPFALI